MKKTITTITLAMTLACGATFTNAGIIIGDKAEGTCTATTTDGIIIGDILQIFGIIIGDKPTPCPQANGIIIGD